MSVSEISSNIDNINLCNHITSNIRNKYLLAINDLQKILDTMPKLKPKSNTKLNTKSNTKLSPKKVIIKPIKSSNKIVQNEIKLPTNLTPPVINTLPQPQKLSDWLFKEEYNYPFQEEERECCKNIKDDLEYINHVNFYH